MDATTRSIEIDDATAALVDRRAAEYSMTISEFIAELVRRDSEDMVAGAADIAELDRRSAEIKQGVPTVSHAEVRRWLETWGTPDFKPWTDPL